ncbi:MAG: ankyrin repeat domain-containing protein, partial [Brevinema sp.]
MKKRYLLSIMISNIIFANEFPAFNTSEFPANFPGASTHQTSFISQGDSSQPPIMPEVAVSLPQEVVYIGFDTPATIPQHLLEAAQVDPNAANIPMLISETPRNENIINISVTNIQTNALTNVYENQSHIVNLTNIVQETSVVNVTNFITNTITNFQTNISKVAVPFVDLNKQNLVDTQKFIKASYAGDLFTLKQLMKKGISPDSRNIYDIKNGVTALIGAAGQRRYSVLELLLKNGANPNLTSSYNGLHGITPLMVAAIQGPIENVELLITFGANVHRQTSGIVTGNSALSAAISASQEEIVDLLLKQKVDINHTINSKKYYGITPL